MTVKAIRLYLCHIEEQSDGIVEVGVGTASINPQVPQYREEGRTGQQHTAHQEDVPQD